MEETAAVGVGVTWELPQADRQSISERDKIKAAGRLWKADIMVPPRCVIVSASFPGPVKDIRNNRWVSVGM